MQNKERDLCGSKNDVKAKTTSLVQVSALMLPGLVLKKGDIQDVLAIFPSFSREDLYRARAIEMRKEWYVPPAYIRIHQIMDENGAVFLVDVMKSIGLACQVNPIHYLAFLPLWRDSLAWMESVLGDGGQYMIAFATSGAHGAPLLLEALWRPYFRHTCVRRTQADFSKKWPSGTIIVSS
ncbi:MAG: hypothetical protein B7X04_00975 [Parcubacteria group bacterium 21-54-25]|nr:MAG: hypothetical protein B7X04_00975 [Parcubacteria group bacterium 21-54-25]HQU07804.1 hypothetical protein [Candidatus Paceibacterota bacterium]